MNSGAAVTLISESNLHPCNPCNWGYLCEASKSSESKDIPFFTETLSISNAFISLGEPVESPSLEILKRGLDMVLGNWLWVALLEQGVDQMISRGSCPPQPLCVCVSLLLVPVLGETNLGGVGSCKANPGQHCSGSAAVTGVLTENEATGVEGSPSVTLIRSLQLG